MNKEQLRKWIAQNKLRDVLEYLNKALPENDKVTLLHSRFSRTKEAQLMGMITAEEYDVQSQTLSRDILAFIDDSEGDFEGTSVQEKQEKNLSNSPHFPISVKVKKAKNVITGDEININSIS